MIEVLNVLKKVCTSYSEHVTDLIGRGYTEERINELKLIKQSLINIRDDRPKTLHESIQLINIYAISSGATELGRIDDYLGNFYVNDIISDIITKNDAISYVDSLFTLIHENLNRDTRAIIGGLGRENVDNSDL